MIWLDNSRIVSIFAVVLLHVAAGVVINNEIGSSKWWVGNIYDSAVRWSVPVFVMISGALLLGNKKNDDLTTFYKRRASRIVVPLIFWTFAYLVWNVLKSVHSGNDVSTMSLLKMILSGKPHYHMWFLYMIIFLYLFSPFLRKITKESSGNEMATVTIACFALAILTSAVNAFMPVRQSLFINWFLPYVPYFFIGYLVPTLKLNFSKYIAYVYVAFVMSIIGTAIGCYFLARLINLDAGLYFYDYLSITVVPMSISIMLILRGWEKPIINISTTKNLSSLTLGVYLVHPMVLESMAYLYPKNINIPVVIYVPVVTFFVFTISLGLVWMLKKLPLVNRTI